ncbi:MAG: DNA recombination/repair protein RecA, partial [Candidatus Omnitrophica bacterium]|nr:DNA recombination/repair protein RecA [Candidatus Omnitrophota bacterium]
IYYNQGISKEGSILDVGVDQKVLEKKGNSFYYGDQNIGPGREQARIYLKEHTEVRDKIEAELRAKINS